LHLVWHSLPSSHTFWESNGRWLCAGDCKLYWNWPSGFWENYLFIYRIIDVFPSYGPIWPPRTMMLVNFNLHNIRKLFCKCELFWDSGSLDKKLNDPILFLRLSPFWRRPALYLCKIEFPLCEDDLYQVWLKIGLLVLEKMISKDPPPPNINTVHVKLVFPIVAPSKLGTICKNLNLHYTRRLLCKSELFRLCGSWEDF
jgi:hypothetical protein